MRDPRRREEDPHLQGHRAAKQNESDDQDQVRLEERLRIELNLCIALSQINVNGMSYPRSWFLYGRPLGQFGFLIGLFSAPAPPFPTTGSSRE